VSWSSSMNVEELRQLLLERFPGSGVLPDVLSGPIRLGHSHMQALRSFVREVNAGIAWEALNDDFRWEDVIAWVAMIDGRSGGGGKSASVSQGSIVQLRPVIPADYQHFYMAAMSPGQAHRWRFRGRTIAPDQFERTFFDGVLAQYSIVNRDNGDLLGLAVAYNSDLSAGYTYLGLLRIPSIRRPRGAGIEGAMLMIEYLFRNFPLRKLYFEVPTYNLDLVQSLVDSQLAVQEGVLHDHFFFEEGFVDQHIIAIYKATWRQRLDSWFGGSQN
jgi:RimJ/RimL family protein N-acetyltransferase